MGFAKLVVPGSGYKGVKAPELTSKRGKPGFSRLAGDYEWQDDAVECLTGSRCSRLIAPTGSGKTEIVKAAAYCRAFKMGQKSLIVVPQQHIAEPFKEIKIVRKGGEEYDHYVKLDFRGVREGNYSAEDVVGRLRAWLLQPARGMRPESRIAVTTASSLVAAFFGTSKLRGLGRRQWAVAFERLWTAIDEGHHLAAVMDEDTSPEELEAYRNVDNKLGDICEAQMRVSTAGTGIVSATHFRGDGVPMFMEKARSRFATYERDFRLHWQWLGLDAFRYDCVGYEGDPMDKLFEAVVSERGEFHIVCLPAENKRFRKANPRWAGDFEARLLSAGIPALNLVDKDAQGRRKAELLAANAEYKRSGKAKYRVIIACNLVREGTDYVPTSRVHDTAPSASATRTVQTIGRMTRRDARKTDIAYSAYFANLEEHADEKKVREHASDRTNIALSGMLIAEDLFSPVRLDVSGGGGRETYTEAEERVFGRDREGIRTKFAVAFDEAKRGGDTSEDAVAACAQTAMAGWRGDKFAGLRVLRELAKRMLRLDSPEPERNRGNAIDPRISVSPGKLDASEIRKAGFDPTERIDGGFALFGSVVTQEELGSLHRIVLPMKSKSDEMMRRATSVRTGSRRDRGAERFMRNLKGKARSRGERAVSPSGSEKG